MADMNLPTSQTIEDDQLLPGAAVSRRLGIPETTLAQWRYLGKGPRYVKVGRHVRYQPADVEAWINGNTRGGDAA